MTRILILRLEDYVGQLVGSGRRRGGLGSGHVIVTREAGVRQLIGAAPGGRIDGVAAHVGAGAVIPIVRIAGSVVVVHAAYTVSPRLRVRVNAIARVDIEIDRQVRAYNPWPGAFTFWRKQRLKVITALPLSPPMGGMPGGEPGSVIKIDGLPAVVTGEGLLRLDQVQLAGKRALSGAEFIRGRPDFIRAQLGET